MSTAICTRAGITIDDTEPEPAVSCIRMPARLQILFAPEGFYFGSGSVLALISSRRDSFLASCLVLATRMSDVASEFL